MVADPDAGALRLADGRRTVADLPDLGGGGGGGGPVAWGDVSGKPSTFPPSSHPHGLADLTQSGASTGQVPRWNGSAWAPATPAAGGGGIAETFETVAKNLGAEGATLAYSGGRLASITYASGVTKTLAYDGSGRLASITLSGATPGGIELVKTLAYTGDALTGISYA
jgi:YD repeat-containing protein